LQFIGFLYVPAIPVVDLKQFAIDPKVLAVCKSPTYLSLDLCRSLYLLPVLFTDNSRARPIPFLTPGNEILGQHQV